MVSVEITKMKRALIILFALSMHFPYVTLGQEIANKEKLSLQAINRKQDSIWILNLPKLEIPDEFRNRELPPIQDNSTQPFLRPVFNQIYANCGQASSVGYAFTYEINRARNLAADTSINQYPPDFVYNFMNYVQGGVSFFHTFDVLKKVGTPTVEEYGGFIVDDIQWMSGYEKYRLAMENRVDEVLAINVSSEEGILTLKHWLVHHMDCSDVGGVALFSASSPWNTVLLPEGSPEEGKNVILGWGEAFHNMTIVGYNDLIRYDYNGDGRYTNNVDLNGDSIIDVRDWEIGGVKIVNSYGIQFCDSGFFYAMYKSLADPYLNQANYKSGIWNNTVLLMKVKEPYEPLLTLKAKICHNSRQAIKISAGISSDTNYLLPEYKLEFPIFNFQGGSYPMQGFSDTIEIGLDITPLLAFANEGKYSRFFVQIDENDPRDIFDGKLLELNVFNNATENTDSSYILNKSIINNGTAYASVVKKTISQKPEIGQDQMPNYTMGEPYNFTFTASNGAPPYHWSVITKYAESAGPSNFPIDSGDKIPNENFGSLDYGRVALELPFPFPFYGKNYDSIWIHIDGFIKFEKSDYPWPYFIDKDLQLRTEQMIAPLFTDLFLSGNENGVWTEISDSSVLIRWKAKSYFLDKIYESGFNFAVRLWKNGKIEFLYGENYSTLNESYACGISDGGENSYQLASNSNLIPYVEDCVIKLIPPAIPNKMSISNEGEFSCLPTESRNYDLNIQVSDRNWISVSKKFLFSNSFQIRSQTAKMIGTSGKKIATVSLDITNHSMNQMENINLSLKFNETKTQLVDSIYILENLNTNETIHIDSAFQFVYDYPYNLGYSNLGEIIAKDDSVLTICDYFFSDGPLILTVNLSTIDDGNDGLIEPGETCYLVFNILNNSKQPVENIKCNLLYEEPYLILLDDLQKQIDIINPYSIEDVKYKVKLSEKTQKGFNIGLIIRLEINGIILDYPINIKSGENGILIVYFKNEQFESAFRLRDLISKTKTFTTETKTGLNWLQGKDYFATIVLLGNYPFNHFLSLDDSQILENYLLDKGNILLIGGNTFWMDARVPIHDYFNIEGAFDGWYSDIDTLMGIPGTFTENMAFDYYGDNYSHDNLFPIDGAFPILNEPGTDFNFAIANEGENYKTIGSSIDIGALTGLNESSSDVIIMRKILDFFGLNGLVAANFYTWETNICNTEQVHFYNTSSAITDHYSWWFEGGEPEYSDERDPIISYTLPGQYDVRLIASSDTNSDTVTKSGYINVALCSAINETEYKTVVYPNPSSNYLNLIYYPKNTEFLKIKLFNIMGTEVFEKKVNNIPSILYETIPLFGLQKGLYFLVIEENDSRKVKKIILN